MDNDDKLLEQSLELIKNSDPYQGMDYTKLKFFFQFYALPIFSALVFLGILFFGVIPTIKEMFATVDEVDQLKVQDQQLDTRIERLTLLRNDNALRQDLINSINFLIPTEKSAVVKFRDRVAKASIQQNLSFENATTGENVVDADGTVASTAGFNLIQIPSEFNITGRFIDFRSFLKKLYIGQDFFIVHEMKLSASPTEDNPENWNGGFNLTKYQFNADEDFVAETAFSAISEFTPPDADVISFLEETFINSSQTEATPNQ